MLDVSVVIPTWNREQAVCRAIESVLKQTAQASEILVIDDGSSDGTAATLRQRYPGVVVLEQNNQGVSAARNRGIRQASGEWIALLDSDDEWLPDKLLQQSAAAEQQPDVRLIHGDEIWIRNGVRVNAMKKHRKYGGWIYPHCLPLCAISPSATLLRRDVFNDVGYFDESLPACEDYDYWLRFCAHEPVVYIDSHLIKKYGGHDDQLSRKFWGMDRFRMQALANMLRSGKLSGEYETLTQTQLVRKLTIFSAGARKRNNHTAADQIEALYHDLVPNAGSEHLGSDYLGSDNPGSNISGPDK